MSFLKEKNKKLFREKNISPEDQEKRESREKFYAEEKKREKDYVFLGDEKKTLASFFPAFKTKRILLWGQSFLFVFLFVLGGFFLFIRYQETSFSEDRLKVETVCPEEIASGKDIVCQVSVENDNRLDLEEVALRINYSDELDFVKSDLGNFNQGLKFGQLDIGQFSAGEKKVFQLEFSVFGQGGSQIFLEAGLRYKLNNFGVTMEKKSQFSGFINSLPLALLLVSSDESAEGEVVEFQTIVKNESEENFSGLLLEFQFPEGFVFLESESEEAKISNELWQVGTLAVGEQKTISFKGTLSGAVSSLKEMKVLLGEKKESNFVKYVETSKMIKLVSSRIQLEHYINNSKDISFVGDGQTLEFKITFKNNSSRPLRDLILIEKLDGLFIDEKKLNLLGKGFYDSVNKQIIWKASEVKELAVLEPGQLGQVSFLVYLKENLAIKAVSQVNQQISYQSEIESLDINSPLGENKKVITAKKDLKVNSNVSLELTGVRESEGFSSFGPMPMEIGVETSVVLRVKIKNSFNDLKNTIVRLTFPSRVTWKDNYKNSYGKVTFNERSNELIWDRGDVKAGAGYYLPEDQLYFQIGVTPSKNDSLEDLLRIVGTWQLTAEDTFTGQKIMESFSNFTFGRLEGI